MKQLRTQQGMSGEAFARRCAEVGHPEINGPVLANIETRRERVSIDEVLALAEALDVAPSELFIEAEPENVGSLSERQQALDEARGQVERAKRRARLANQAFTLAEEEAQAKQARLDDLGQKSMAMAMAGWPRLQQEAEEAARRVEAARHERIDAGVALEEAREGLERLEPVSRAISAPLAPLVAPLIPHIDELVRQAMAPQLAAIENLRRQLTEPLANMGQDMSRQIVQRALAGDEPEVDKEEAD